MEVRPGPSSNNPGPASSSSAIEDCLIKMINDFAQSFRLLNQPDTQIQLWLDTLNTVVTNILDVYKICFVTKNNVLSCQNVVDSLTGLKRAINPPEDKIICNPQKGKKIAKKGKKNIPQRENVEKENILNKIKPLEPPELEMAVLDEMATSQFTFGDIDYQSIMNDIERDKGSNWIDNPLADSDLEEFGGSQIGKKSVLNCSVQTDEKITKCSCLKKMSKCSIGVQVNIVKPPNFSQNNFNSDYNLNDPYMCNQNYDDMYPNLHYYNDSCPYPNDIDRTYSENTNNFNHQYPPITCSPMPMPGRNISAPVFLPRLISPSPVQHSGEHNVPYTITMFSSSQSYIPSTFNGSVGPPQQFVGVPNHSVKENRKSHRKSEFPLAKRHKSSISKSKSAQKRDKSPMHGEAKVTPSSSCEKPNGYLTKIDELEKTYNVDSISDRHMTKTNKTYICDKSDSLESESFDDTSRDSYCGPLSDFSKMEVVLPDLKIQEDESDYSSPETIIDVSMSNEENSYEQNMEFTETPLNNEATLNNVKSSQMGPYVSLCNSESALTGSLNTPVIENNEDLSSDSNGDQENDLGTESMTSMKKTFVTALTDGLKNTPDSETRSEIYSEVDQTLTPPNLFELSQFPSLKPSSSQPLLKNSDQTHYFDQCKPTQSCAPSVNEKTERENGGVVGYSSSSLSKVECKSLIEKSNLTNNSTIEFASAATKALPPRRSAQVSCHRRNRRNPKTAPLMKNSSYSQPKNTKVNGTLNTSYMIKKSERIKSDEITQPKKHTTNKRKSVPGEDGWVTVPSKNRYQDHGWNSKEPVKRNDLPCCDSTISDDFEIRPDSEINNSKINKGALDMVHPDSQVNGFSLNRQEPYFQSAPLRCASTFGVIDNLDFCHDLSVVDAPDFSLPPIGTMDAVGESATLQNTSLGRSSEQYSSPDFCVPSTSGITLNTNNRSEINSSDISNPELPQLGGFLENPPVNEELSISGELERLAGEASRNSIYQDSVMNFNVSCLEDIKLNKWPNYEESIANFLSHNSSCWSDLFKPDSEEQHLNEEDFRKSKELQEEAQMLQEKIKDLQSNENENDTENEGEYENSENPDAHEIFEEYTNFLSEIACWGDQMDEMEKFQEMLSPDPDDTIFKFQYGSIEQFREFVEKYPGKALDLHQKLLVRSKRSNSDELNEIRRKKAEEKRQRLLNRKAAKMRELLQRVEEVKQAQLQIIEERKCRIDLKLKKAEENRNLHLKTIQKKAHDEEEKLKEIAFINELEAQNRRHDSLALRQEQEERLQNIMEERQRKVDEKAAKEAAVGERKRVLEAERQEKIEKIQQKRREKEEIIGKKQQEREMERLEMAREKAREREERLQAIQAAQIANVEELQKKIKQKQENMARRHEENLQHIKQKAVETGMLRNTQQEDSNSDASSKNTTIVEKKKAAQLIVFEIEEPISGFKYQKKRCKKIRARLQRTGSMIIEQVHETRAEGRLFLNMKISVDILRKLYENHEITSDFGLSKLEKQLCKLMHTIVMGMPDSKDLFKYAYGFEELQRILVHLLSPEILAISSSIRCIESVLDVLVQVCDKDIENIEYFLSCNHTCDMIDAMSVLFSGLMGSLRETHESVIHISALLLSFQDMILRCCSPTALEICASQGGFISKGLLLMLRDFVSYLLYSGLLKKLSDTIKLASLDPVECKTRAVLIEAIVLLVTHLVRPHYFWKDFEDLLVTTDFMGTICLLYGHLHRARQNFPPFTVVIINFFKAIASDQLMLFQKVVGADGFALQFRYIAGYILQHSFIYKCSRLEELLNNTILVIGYFAVKNPENQSILQSGQAPTVLQQLTSLPIQYFCDTELKPILFPTLIAICDGNPVSRELLENEMSYNHIENFLADPSSAYADVLVALHMLEQMSLR